MKWVILLLLLCATVSAGDILAKGNITLLALVENGTTKTGSVAALELELRPGSERVFLETFPMTKVTTQASLRFAQQITCNYLDIDCSKYDFLYSIRAMPGIVGGPSAGGAAALLTAALLLNKTLPKDIAMTGTINSGGMIGPVGGLKYKVEAAGGNGIKIVLLPKGTKDLKEEDNKTIDLVEFGKNLNLTVKEVATLGEVLEQVLGIPQQVSNEDLRIEDRYQHIMKEVADDLCKRSDAYFSKPLKENLTQAKNFTQRAAIEQQKSAHYAAASFCFRANVEYQNEWYKEQNFTKAELEKKVAQLNSDADKLKKDVEARNITTLTDLQTFMAVMERVDEAKDLLSGVSDDLKNNKTDSAGSVGFAEERLFSGVTWSRFFNGQDKLVIIDKAALQASCVAKISEAEERYNYVKSVIPEALDATRGDIDKAYGLLNSEKYIMCLYTSSKAKSEADVLLSLMGVEEKRFNEVIDLKLHIAQQALMKAQHKNVFPIIAYSYYEYANSLRDFDRVSAMLFAEYSLELSNLDIYFEPKKRASTKPAPIPKIPPVFCALIIGIFVGGLFIWIIARQMSKKRLSSDGKFQTLQAPSKRRLRGKKR
jgi:uncharacterized protein